MSNEIVEQWKKENGSTLEFMQMIFGTDGMQALREKYVGKQIKVGSNDYGCPTGNYIAQDVIDSNSLILQNTANEIYVAHKKDVSLVSD
jgi:hypothetical protein